jgi:2'-5' RNA ligase
MRLRFQKLLANLNSLAESMGTGSFLYAAKADDLKKKYQDKAEEIDILADADPTSQKKYLDWSVRMLLAGDDVNDIAEAVKGYHDVVDRLQGSNRDVNSFRSLLDMQEAVDGVKEKETKGVKKSKAKQGGIILYEDSRWQIVHPTTMDGAIRYGSNTSWCVSRRNKDKNYFYKPYVAERNVQFYFIIDTTAERYTKEVADERPGPHFSKVAALFADGKPHDDEPFQDAANKKPRKEAVRDALGPEEFDRLYAIAREHAKRHLTTWAYGLLNAKDEETFNKLYKENSSEVKYLDNKDLVISAIKAGAEDFLLDTAKKALAKEDRESADLLSLLMDNYYSPAFIAELAKSKDVDRRNFAANSPYASADTLRLLAKDPEDSVIAGLASNTTIFNYPDVVEEVLVRTSTDYDRGYKQGVDYGPGMDYESSEEFHADKAVEHRLLRRKTIVSLMRNVGCTDVLFAKLIDELKEISDKPFYYLHSILVSTRSINENNIMEVISSISSGKIKLKGEEDVQLAEALAYSRSATPKVIKELFDYLSTGVYAPYSAGARAINVLAHSLKTPPEVLMQMATKAVSLGVDEQLLASNPNTPSEVVDSLVELDTGAYALAATSNPNISRDSLARIIDYVTPTSGQTRGTHGREGRIRRAIITSLLTNPNATTSDFDNIFSDLSGDASTGDWSQDLGRKTAASLLTGIASDLANSAKSVEVQKKLFDIATSGVLDDEASKTIVAWLNKNRSLDQSILIDMATKCLTNDNNMVQLAAFYAVQTWNLPLEVVRKVANKDNWKIDTSGSEASDVINMANAVLARRKGEEEDLVQRLNASVEKLHAVKASVPVLLAMEEAAELLSAGNVGGLDRNHATVITIPLPKHLADRFPGPEHNNGHEAHITVCFLTAKELSSGKTMEVLDTIRRVCRRQGPFRVGMDINSGLQDFGPSDSGSKALWFSVREDPSDILTKLHYVIRRALQQEGLPCDAHKSFTPHVTWRYVGNDQSEGERQRMSSFAANRFNDTRTWFDVRHLVMSSSDGSQKVIALSPALR